MLPGDESIMALQEHNYWLTTVQSPKMPSALYRRASMSP